MTDEQFKRLCAAPLDASSRDALRAEAIRARESERRLAGTLRDIIDELSTLSGLALAAVGVEVENG